MSSHRFRSNGVRLWLSLIAYNLGYLWQRLALSLRVGNWPLTSLQQRLVNTGGRLVKHARYYWLLLAEGHLTRRLFGAMLRRIAALPVPAAQAKAEARELVNEEVGDRKVSVGSANKAAPGSRCRRASAGRALFRSFASLGEVCFHALHDLRGPDFEDLRQPDDGPDPGAFDASLDQAHVGPVEAGIQGQPLLRDLSFLADLLRFRRPLPSRCRLQSSRSSRRRRVSSSEKMQIDLTSHHLVWCVLGRAFAGKRL